MISSIVWCAALFQSPSRRICKMDPRWTGPWCAGILLQENVRWGSLNLCDTSTAIVLRFVPTFRNNVLRTHQLSLFCPEDRDSFFSKQSNFDKTTWNTIPVIIGNHLESHRSRLIWFCLILLFFMSHVGLDRRRFFECKYEGWNFNSGNYLFTTDTK